MVVNETAFVLMPINITVLLALVMQHLTYNSTTYCASKLFQTTFAFQFHFHKRGLAHSLPGAPRLVVVVTLAGISQLINSYTRYFGISCV